MWLPYLNAVAITVFFLENWAHVVPVYGLFEFHFYNLITLSPRCKRPLFSLRFAVKIVS